MKRTLLALSLYVPICAIAQYVDVIQINGQPLVYMKDGKVNGCGLRLFGTLPGIRNADWRSFDASFNVFLPGDGMVKIMSYNTTPAELRSDKPIRTVPVENGWMKAPNNPSTSPLNGIHKGEDGVSILYNTDLDSIIGLFVEQAKGSAINVGIRRRGESGERIYSGPVTMSDQEQNQVRQCMREFFDAEPK